MKCFHRPTEQVCKLMAQASWTSVSR